MPDRSFETKLVRDMTAMADDGVRPVDAWRLAQEIVGTGRPSRARLVLGFTISRARWLAVAAILLLVLVLSALVVGGYATERNRLGPLAFIRGGDAWAAAMDGSNQRLVAAAGPERHEYLYVRWSPDANLLVTVRDVGDVTLVPAIELFDRDGRRLWSKTLDPGGLPDVSWAPDGHRLAVAAFPTIAPTDGDLLAPIPADAVTPMTVTILGVDGPRTTASLRAAAPPLVRPGDAGAIVWGDPWVRWSPTADAIAVKVLAQRCCDTELWTISSDGSTKRRVVGPAAGVVPQWFAWRPNGRDLDFTGPARDAACAAGEVDAGVCTAGFWTTDPGGAISFTAVPSLAGTGRPGDSFVQSVTWFADQRRALLASSVVRAQPIEMPSKSSGPDCIASLDIFDPVAGTRVNGLSGSWTFSAAGAFPATVSGEAFEQTDLAWADGSTSLFRLGAGDGVVSTDGWSIRVSDMANGGPSSTAVDAAVQFDLASRP